MVEEWIYVIVFVIDGGFDVDVGFLDEYFGGWGLMKVNEWELRLLRLEFEGGDVDVR